MQITQRPYLPIDNVALGQSLQPTGCLPAKPNFKEENTRAKTEFRSPHTSSPVDHRLPPFPRLL